MSRFASDDARPLLSPHGRHFAFADDMEQFLQLRRHVDPADRLAVVLCTASTTPSASFAFALIAAILVTVVRDGERRLAAEQNVHDDAEAPDVALDPVPAALPLIRANHLWGHVLWRSADAVERHGALDGVAVAASALSVPQACRDARTDPQVRQLHGRRLYARVPRRVEKDIFWLEVRWAYPLLCM